MHPFVIKYFQLVSIVFLFDNISCESLSLEASRDNFWLNREASCMAICMEKKSTAVLIECHGKCQAIERTSNSVKTFSNETIRLICQDSDSLTIEIGIDDVRNYNEINITNSRKFHGNLYMIRVQESKREIQEKIVYIADKPIITIGNLTKNTEYYITASIFTGEPKHRHLPDMKKIKTLSNDKYIPAPIPVEAITVDYIFTNDSLKPSTLIRWKSEDFVCKYGFVFFDKSPHKKKFPIYKILSEPRQLYNFKTGHIEFNNTYEVRIVGVNTKDNVEGEPATYNFTTPTCHMFYQSNLRVCPPLEPENLQTSHVLTSQHSYYEIIVEWNLPAILPDEYNVSLYFENSPEVWQNVSGTEVNAIFKGVFSRDPTYDVFVTAISEGGTETASIRNAKLTSYTEMLEHYQAGIRIVKFVLPVLVFLIILLITLNIKYRPKLSAKEIILRQMAQAHNKDSKEVIPTDVEIHGVIGEGAFGIVKKGILKPINRPVAVKMLKENASTDDVEAFLREITLMKSIRKHVNIVGIVGHCTSNYENMMLLIEYCSAGNLLEYLRFFQKTGRIEHINSVTAVETEFMPTCKMGSYDSFFDKIQMKVFSNGSESLNRKGKIATINSVMNKLYDEFDNNMKCVDSLSYKNEPNGIYVETAFNNDGSNMKFVPKLSEPPLIVANQCYDLFQSPQKATSAQIVNCKDDKDLDGDFDSDALRAEDLLRFAKQIAVGMEFLSNCKIVHRDLAARNVLVCADKTVKIADFGLSRDIYEDDVYMKASTGRLPIKWLALESMAKQEYTTKSDVWSFGILCSEIVTLGDTPYPDVSADEILDHLKSGKRLKKPDTCSDEFYQMMFTCWYDDPKLRPSFTELIQDINKFIAKSKEFGTLVIDVLNRKQSLDRASSSSRAYLRPVSDDNN